MVWLGRILVLLVSALLGVQLPDELSTIFAVIAVMMLAEEAIDRVWDLNGLAAQIRAISIAVLMSTAGALFGWGMFFDPSVCGSNAWFICGPLVGLGAGAVGALGFKLEIVRAALELLGIRPKIGENFGEGKKPSEKPKE